MPLDIPKPKNYRRAWNGGAAADHLKDEWTITVCAKCNCAACWQGEFYCDGAKTASAKEITIREARELNRENPTYWLRDEGIKRRIAASWRTLLRTGQRDEQEG